MSEALVTGLQVLVFDVDGTLTDGRLYMDAEGRVTKSFDVRDGMAMTLAKAQGLAIGIITGRNDECTQVRARELGVDFCLLGVKDKCAALQAWLDERGVTPQEVGFMGDDLNDLAMMEYVGVSAAPSDACSEVRSKADFIAHRNGGCGAVRDWIEWVLQQQGKWKYSKQSSQ